MFATHANFPRVFQLSYYAILCTDVRASFQQPSLLKRWAVPPAAREFRIGEFGLSIHGTRRYVCKLRVDWGPRNLSPS